MNYKIAFKKGVVKQVEHISKKQKQQIKEKIIKLQSDPFQPGVIKLKNSESSYRYRAGDYRVLFTVDKEAQQITIYKILHRKDVYE